MKPSTQYALTLAWGVAAAALVLGSPLTCAVFFVAGLAIIAEDRHDAG